MGHSLYFAAWVTCLSALSEARPMCSRHPNPNPADVSPQPATRHPLIFPSPAGTSLFFSSFSLLLFHFSPSFSLPLLPFLPYLLPPLLLPLYFFPLSPHYPSLSPSPPFPYFSIHYVDRSLRFTPIPGVYVILYSSLIYSIFLLFISYGVAASLLILLDKLRTQRASITVT